MQGVRWTEEDLAAHRAKMAGHKAATAVSARPANATRDPGAKARGEANAVVEEMQACRSASADGPDQPQLGAGAAAAERVSRGGHGPGSVAGERRLIQRKARPGALAGDVTGGERPAPIQAVVKNSLTGKRKRRTPEQDFQKDCVKFLNAALPPSWRVVHVPNGGTTGGHKAKIVGGIRKAMGVREGFPDLMLVGPGRSVAIELKAAGRRGKVLSTAQEEWRDWFASVGLPWFLARSIEDVIAACQDAGVPLRVRV